MELQRSSDLTVEGANVVFNQTQNKELVHMIVSMIQRSGDGDNTSLSIMDERPVIEDKIMLIRAEDGKIYGERKDPNTGSFYRPISGKHASCMEEQEDEFGLYFHMFTDRECILENDENILLRGKNCEICGKKLV